MKIVALEGLHGVGKTTVAEILATAMGVDVLETPYSAFRSIAPWVDANCERIAARLFFLAATKHTSDIICRDRGTLDALVLDRYIHSLQAMHRPGAVGRYLLRHMEPPTLSILLTAGEEKRTERLESRRASPPPESWLMGAKHAQERARCLRVFRRLCDVTIDTTSVSPAVVASTIIKLL